jgi:hypothetical protein
MCNWKRQLFYFWNNSSLKKNVTGLKKIWKKFSLWKKLVWLKRFHLQRVLFQKSTLWEF